MSEITYKDRDRAELVDDWTCFSMSCEREIKPGEKYVFAAGFYAKNVAVQVAHVGCWPRYSRPFVRPPADTP